jgi:methionine-rich copper-binding protein CopC
LGPASKVIDGRLPYLTVGLMDSGAPRRYRAPRLAWKGIVVPICCKFWLPAALAALLIPVLAQAHAILEESTPPAGASVKAGPLDLRLRYNSRIDQARSRLTLIRPDHSHDIVPIASGTPPDIISAHLALTPGDYIVRWQVLAVDGHITRGDVPITVTAP